MSTKSILIDQAVEAEEYAEECLSHFAGTMEKLDSLSNINTFERLSRFQGKVFSDEQIEIAHGVILRAYLRAIGRA